MKYLNSILDILFPKKCINCGKLGSFLCEDCLYLIEINPFKFCLCETPQKLITPKCHLCANNSLDEIYSACDLNNRVFQKTIKSINEKYIKDLCLPLSFLILSHLEVVGKELDKDFVIVPVPITDKEKRKKGFNESEEIARAISEATHLPLLKDVIIKTNKNNFEIKNKEISNKNILLINIICTDMTNMEECSRILKESGANKVFGIVAGRG
jgi:predicted amidophosphoribosyltransferase